MNVRSGRPLSSTFVQKVTRPGSYGDGYGSRGLTLRVKRLVNGRTSKTWTQRLVIGGKPTNLGLGRWPEVGLAFARDKAIVNACAVAEGIDPRAAAAPTVAEAVEAVIAQREPTWKHAGRTAEIWRSSLRRHAPTVMAMPVDEVTSAHVLAAVGPVWRELPATGRKVRRRLSIAFRWAIASGFRTDDPAAEAVLAALPSTNGNRVHIAAEHHSKVAEALAAIDASKRAHPNTKKVLHLLALTATRSAEVRGMRWHELDVESRTWTLPPARTKSNREHIVPLSHAALRIIDARPSRRRRRAARVPKQPRHRTHQRCPVEALQRTGPDHAAPRVANLVPGLVCRDRRLPRGGRGCARSRRRRHRRRLPAQRPARPARCSHGRLGRLPHILTSLPPRWRSAVYPRIPHTGSAPTCCPTSAPDASFRSAWATP